MQSAVKLRAERKAKLATSYQELLEEFSSKDLTTVGNYSLGKLIGKGSFGKVYLASHKLTNGSKVVLKSAKKDDSNLAREIHHHRQFLHPHIARLYEVIVTESLVWLVLEYCPGDELYNYLINNGALPVEKAQKIFTQLVGAVSYVHNMSCVHRDLKLENILLDKNENVKLVDFGFTREYEGKASYLQTFCGTVCYSAPEMLKGEKYAGEKVDVWSLGVILYALLCGELPFDEDDDNLTRKKILGSEPRYPEHLPADAKSLIAALLSKRPLLRPLLADILTHPFLAEHAPQQQAILKLQQPAPFTTPLEKETLQRMRSSGVDIDQLIENVLAKRCDALAGWWTLLLEKEERKQKRRERKQREKEMERRNSRRLSGASSRLERIAPSLTDVGEDGTAGTPRSRGRRDRRSAHYPELIITDLPGLPENAQLSSPAGTVPPPIEKDSIRSASSSRHRRPIPPPKEGVLRSARSRGSTLQLVTSNPDLLSPNGITKPRTSRRRQLTFINHFEKWKHWIMDTTRRGKSPNTNGNASTPNLHSKAENSPRAGTKVPSPRPATSKTATTNANNTSSPAAYIAPPRLFTTPTNKRNSLSPAPLTPRSTYRRPSSGLRGRKSTSSSVSSIRSIPLTHHQHTHSKASSTSSTAGSDIASKVPLSGTRSPHHSVKVLPATPTTGSFSFPSNIRVVRQAVAVGGGDGTSGGGGGGSWAREASPGGLVFAKRKRNVFKGPRLDVTSSPSGGGGGMNGGGGGGGGKSHSRSTSVSGVGRRSGEIIVEEEEDEDEVEEVEVFSPIERGVEVEEVFGAGETPLGFGKEKEK